MGFSHKESASALKYMGELYLSDVAIKNPLTALRCFKHAVLNYDPIEVLRMSMCIIAFIRLTPLSIFQITASISLQKYSLLNAS